MVFRALGNLIPPLAWETEEVSFTVNNNHYPPKDSLVQSLIISALLTRVSE